MEKKKLIVLKLKKSNESIELKEELEKEHKIETIIQEYIDNKIDIIDIIEKEAPNNIELQEQIWKIYNNLKWEIIIQNNKEDEILKLWNKLRPYQIEYIEEAVTQLLDNIKNHKKCLIKSPTSSGKTVMIYWIIAKLYKALSSPNQFNITLLTPFTKLCSQSIKDEDNINILKAHNMNANYMQYDYKNRDETEHKLFKNKNEKKYINFISVCNPSMLKFINFIDKENIKVNISIYDEFHFIKKWQNSNEERHKCIKSPHIEYMLFTSATPDKTQETKTEIYGEVINKITLKELIRLKYACPIIPLVEINNLNPKDPEEIKLQKSFGKYYKFPYMIKESFKEYNKKKAILFCNNTANCFEMYDLLKNRSDILGNIKVFHPYIDNKKVKYNKNIIKNNNKDSNITIESILNKDLSSDIESSSDIDDLTEEETITTIEEKQNIEYVLKEYENCLEPCILITCRKISVGYSHPPIDFVIIADNKVSITDISQSIGRGIRLYGSTKECHVLLFNSDHSSIKSFIEYFQNDVGLNIESIIRKEVYKKYKKYTELNHQFDLTIKYDELKFLNKTWLQVYGMTNVNNKNIKKLEYDILYNLVREMKFKHKDEYKKWAQLNNENDNPEIYFKDNGWINYYNFLNINIDMYPKTIEELKEICISNNIKSMNNYETRMNELNMPNMPFELYGKKLCFINNQINIGNVINYVSEEKIIENITSSKIKKCKINNEDINIFNYRPILRYIYNKMDRESIIKNTKLNCKQEKLNDKGFSYYEKLNLSIQGADAKKTLTEIINMIKVNESHIELEIELKDSNEIINYKL